MASVPPTPDETANLDAIWAQIDAALDVEEHRWTPAPGDKLLGTIAALDLLPGNDNGAYYVVRVDTLDGRRVSFAASRARLRNQLASAQAQPGDLLGVKYNGEQIAESSGRAFHDYTVSVVNQGARDPQRVFRAEPPAPTAADDLLPEPGDDRPPF